MRKPLIAGNWKMNKNIHDTIIFFEELNSYDISYTGKDVIIFPPYTSLSQACEETKALNIEIGAQNFFCESNGAYTGEISPEMLKEIHVKYVLTGHSERRNIFGEDDNLINRKVINALKNNILPILCVGELLEERQIGNAETKIKYQIENDLKGITKEQVTKIIIAYEPIWAIGTGKTATSNDANQMIVHIRKILSELFGVEISEVIRILYGGSVKPDNIKDIMSQSDIDGVLVGGASLKAKDFKELINYQEIK